VVLQATGIEHKSCKVSAVSAAELSVKAADIKVSGQVLHAVAYSSSSQHSTSLCEPATLNPPSDMSFPEHSSPQLGYSSDIAYHVAFPTAHADTSGVSVPSAPIICTPNQSLAAVPYLDSFFWIGDYIKFNALKAKKDKGKKSETSASEKISHNTLILTVPGYVIEPISGLLVGASDPQFDTDRINPTLKL
jgi:hypothetical protein